MLHVFYDSKIWHNFSYYCTFVEYVMVKHPSQIMRTAM